MEEYSVEIDEDGNVEPCDCCGYDAATKAFKDGMPRRDFRLCEVCSTTFLANIGIIYPDQHPQINQMAQSIGWAVNKILDEIAKKP